MYIHGRSRALGLVAVPFDPADPGTAVVGADRRRRVSFGSECIGQQQSYLQQPDRLLTELQTVTARETFGDSGLPQAIAIDLGGLVATIDIRGHAPIFGLAQELLDRHTERGGAVGHIPYGFCPFGDPPWMGICCESLQPRCSTTPE
jgi:hypothetical protein